MKLDKVLCCVFLCALCTLTMHRTQWMLLIPGTGNGELGTGVWELVCSGNPLENSRWRTKEKKRLKELRETIWVNVSFLPAVLPDDQYMYVLVTAESVGTGINKARNGA